MDLPGESTQGMIDFIQNASYFNMQLDPSQASLFDKKNKKVNVDIQTGVDNSKKYKKITVKNR